MASTAWGDSVVSYIPGAGAAPGYGDPTAALGQPTRLTGESFGFPGVTTPFSGAFEPDEIVSIGVGGSLTIRFDDPIADDPLNPYGIDLLVFGNSFFFDPDNFADPTALFLSSDGGLIEVSADGIDWRPVPGVEADGQFPTLGYQDISDPYSSPAGTQPTDFTRPVNPLLAWHGMTLPQLIAAYDGSGGGAGVDLAGTGLSQVSYVRVSLAPGFSDNIEIDAFSDVTPIPAPASLLGLSLGLCTIRRRRARWS